MDNGPCARAKVFPFAARKPASSNVPPNKLRASPLELTVTSRVSPSRAVAGSAALTMTTATLRLFTCSGGTDRLNCDSTLERAWRVARLPGESPVPASPVTMPVPTSTFSRQPCTLPSSFTRSGASFPATGKARHKASARNRRILPMSEPQGIEHLAPPRPPIAVRDIPLAHVRDARLRNPGRLDDVAVAHVHGPHQAFERHALQLLVHRDRLSAGDTQLAIGKHLLHGDAQGGQEFARALRAAPAVEIAGHRNAGLPHVLAAVRELRRQAIAAARARVGAAGGAGVLEYLHRQHISGPVRLVVRGQPPVALFLEEALGAHGQHASQDEERDRHRNIKPPHGTNSNWPRPSTRANARPAAP